MNKVCHHQNVNVHKQLSISVMSIVKIIKIIMAVMSFIKIVIIIMAIMIIVKIVVAIMSIVKMVVGNLASYPGSQWVGTFTTCYSKGKLSCFDVCLSVKKLFWAEYRRNGKF